MAVIELGSWNKQPKGVTHSYVGARSGLVDLLPAIIYLFIYLFIYLSIYLCCLGCPVAPLVLLSFTEKVTFGEWHIFFSDGEIYNCSIYSLQSWRGRDDDGHFLLRSRACLGSFLTLPCPARRAISWIIALLCICIIPLRRRGMEGQLRTGRWWGR
jgi:hypothetical protein